jgi:hypothetical protein
MEICDFTNAFFTVLHIRSALMPIYFKYKYTSAKMRCEFINFISNKFVDHFTGLFYYTVSMSDYVASNGRTIDK